MFSFSPSLPICRSISHSFGCVFSIDSMQNRHFYLMSVEMDSVANIPFRSLFAARSPSFLVNDVHHFRLHVIFLFAPTFRFFYRSLFKGKKRQKMVFPLSQVIDFVSHSPVILSILNRNFLLE